MQHTMKIVSAAGHDTLTWTEGDALSTEEVERRFNELTTPWSQGGKGMRAFSVPAGNVGDGDTIKKFDPSTDIQVVGAYQGG